VKGCGRPPCPLPATGLAKIGHRARSTAPGRLLPVSCTLDLRLSLLENLAMDKLLALVVNPDAAIWAAFLSTTGLIDVCTTVDCGSDATIIDKFAYRSNDAVTIEPLSHRFEREKFVRPDGMPLSDHDALTVRFRWTSVE
jgi:hypothetical protein